MIELKNISKAYLKNKNIIENLNLTIKNGEIFGFLGPNGAGKTTTIKMITGIIKPSNGEVYIDGISIKEKPLEAKKNFSYVPDSPDMFLSLTGNEYLNFMADMYDIPLKIRTERINNFATQFEIIENLDQRILEYSHGMRQKIVLIGALLNDSNNLILDEPMVGLDPKAAYVLKKIVREYANANKTVLFSTHVLEIAEKICDRVCIINKGEIIAIGTIDEIKQKFNNGTLENIFLEITEDE